MNTPTRLPGDVLALVTSTSPWSAAATAAIAIAAKCQANVSGCYVDASLRMLHGGEAEPSVLALLLDAPTENADDRDAFASLARAANVPHAHWLVTRASIAATVRQLGAWHDLVVIDRDLVDESIFFDVLGEALMMCRAPSLVLPSGWNGAPRFGRIVLAWNGSIEAIRTIHAALPFLQMAQETVLIDGESPHYEDDQPRAPHFDAVAYLASHGVRARTRRLHVAPHEAGEALLRETAQVHGDLLVMGAYGHSRVRERVLGGATRHVLQHARVPVFMQH
ncbi:universal stress protein [Dyella solisilvae]|uniref:Universal stress protein n=1 Tax=Dyella solisilvae TaxID=1920168 RepID=A0A370K9X5_9GAMM|nr:universal stress protein [Dyella solisilvae]RDI99439.1 universal stress protein [Dyella solisilvae]